MLDVAYLIPALPLAGFVVLVCLGRRAGDPGAGWVATSAIGLAFLSSFIAYVQLLGKDGEARAVVKPIFTWIRAGGFEVEAGLLVDQLSLTMALFVTGVGTLIHLYSIGYMKGDERFPRFFVYLNLFAFSMLVLVLGDSFLLTFLGWEGVGACSYLLVSFWFERNSAASAGKKAFVVNRVGDFGFMLAMFLVFATFGTLDYQGVLSRVDVLTATTATAIALLLFVGACGKSAQLPLFVWLPDAMEGPTPVSALIHAATMVTAGVYLMARVSPILALSEEALTVIAVVGALTAFFAATVACAQNDIKRVLAYSTVSQLGYMFLAVGSGAYVAAVFHMVTHAFFKALLFLGAGSVIHGLHDQQDMKHMGALRRLMPVTAVTFIIGWLAIAGVPPFAGFWSKDDILLAAYDKSPLLWGVGVVTALLTAYYMSRQVFLVFYGGERWRKAPTAGAHAGGGGAAHDAKHAHDAGTGGHGAHGDAPHEGPWVMTLPLVVLASLAALGGLLNLPFGESARLEHWLEPVFGEALRHVEASSAHKQALAAAAGGAALVGIAIAYGIFIRGRRTTAFEPPVLQRAWGIDALYSALIEKPGHALSTFAARVVDARVIDGAVNGVASLVRAGGGQLRKVQTGYVRNYALGVAFGATVLLGLVVMRAGA
ncbi:MAG: NADH-quinone oxidoreductase subunit L [Actinomycetota bacterium]|nr:NADH-quinone oxidoreductase subunit L [Actinomycetota bacterium]